MSGVIDKIIPLAVGKSISPLLNVAEILLLTDPQGRPPRLGRRLSSDEP